MKKVFFKYISVFILFASAEGQPPVISSENESYPGESLNLPEGTGEKPGLPETGEIKGFHSKGSMLFKGFLKSGKLHNQWGSWYANGNPMDAGNFQKGVPDGAWQVWNADGTPKFLRTYSADKWERFQQEATRYNPRRINYPLTQLYNTNRKEANKYISGRKDYCSPAGCTRSVAENILQTAINNDEEKHYHPVFEKGLLHGLYINYFPNGAVKDSGYYKNGLPEGVWVNWSDDASSYRKGYYRHGQKNKEWKIYSADGRLRRIENYKAGKLVWEKDF